MNKNLRAQIRKAIEEVRVANVTDRAVKSSLVGLVRSLRGDSPDRDGGFAHYFLGELFGKNSFAYRLYMEDYRAAIRGDLDFIPHPVI